MKTIIGKMGATSLALPSAALLVMCAIYPAAAQDSSASVSVEGSPNTMSQTAIGTVDAFHAALKRSDTKFALSLMSEDVVIFESGYVETGRAEYAAHHLQADAEFSAATIRKPVSDVVMEEGDLANVMRVDLVNGSFHGRPVNSRSVETMLLRKTRGQWRIFHIHWSSTNLKK